MGMTADKNKEKFLTELREYLSILEEQEQEDILAEYAQHIDMKMQKGLSEEEAIRDFGSVQELAAEILAAYHVDSQHALSAGRRRIWPAVSGRNTISMGRQDPGRNGNGRAWPGRHKWVRFFGSADGLAENEDGQAETDGTEGFWSRTGRQIREMTAGMMRGIRKAFVWFGGKCRRFAEWCRKPFAGRGAAAGEDEAAEGSRIDGVDGIAGHESGSAVTGNGRKDIDSAGSISLTVTGETVNGESGKELQTEMSGTGKVQKRKGTMGRFFRATGQGTVRIGKWFLGCCIFWLKLLWNTGWLLFSLFCAAAAMLVLMGIGITAILLCYGYPFMGILLVELGGLLCFGALSSGAFGMMTERRWRRDGRKEERIGVEVHYE